jgi:hypothetical protein
MNVPKRWVFPIHTLIGVFFVGLAGSLLVVPGLERHVSSISGFDLFFRVSLSSLVGFLGYSYLVLARESWLRSYGVEPVAVEMRLRDVFVDDDPRGDDPE